MSIVGVAYRKEVWIVDLIFSDSGRTLMLTPGQDICIKLGENPTTGYRWQVVGAGDPVLFLTNDSFTLGSSAAVGGGGTRTLQFHTGKTGAATLRIEYGRPGVAASVKRVFLLNVRVS